MSLAHRVVSCSVGALEAVRGGGADVCLVVGAEVQTTVSSREGGDYLARASHYQRERSIDDFVFPAMFGRRTKAYREAFGLEELSLARLTEKAFANANKNPLAHMHHVRMDAAAALSTENNPQFLSNEELKPFLKVSDCSQVSDGGAALLLVSEAGLDKLGRTLPEAVEVAGFSQATGNLYEDSNPLALDTVAAAAERALAEAGLDDASGVGVAEVHDCFTMTEILMYEALGWAKPGEGAGLIGGERAAATNTGGGLVGFGHPVGATGVKQLLEIYRQMKGACGAYQLDGAAPELGIAANMGGDDKTACVTILKNL